MNLEPVEIACTTLECENRDLKITLQRPPGGTVLCGSCGADLTPPPEEAP